jgi:predicted dehydrogenase
MARRMTNRQGPVRFGTLGAARITPTALLRPARENPEVEVVTVAARDQSRAETFGRRHGIPGVAASYDAVVESPDVDAVYIPLPNGLHAGWILKAIEAGKHVLCEKPLTANASEAEEVASAAAASGVVVMEAFHYRYHPMIKRALQIVQSGEIGRITDVETAVCFPLPRFSDIRYQLELAGGATMDAGCYAIHMARVLAGAEPEVMSARARLRSPQIDRAMAADLRFPDGAGGKILTSLWSSSLLRTTAGVRGEAGRLSLLNPLAPQFWHRMKVVAPGTRRVEHFDRRSTYSYQLDAFCDAVLRGRPVLTPPTDSVANMRVIDAVYEAAGLRPRGAAE